MPEVSLDTRAEWTSPKLSPIRRAPAVLSITVTYVYCCGNVRPAAPGHDALNIKIIWIDTKQTMLQDLLPIAIFH